MFKTAATEAHQFSITNDGLEALLDRTIARLNQEGEDLLARLAALETELG